MRARRVAAIAVLAFASLCPTDGFAQERLAVQTDLLFYGDNTEFSNPFREGETIFGAALRVAGVVDLNDRVRLSVGAFGNQRFGSDRELRAGPAGAFGGQCAESAPLSYLARCPLPELNTPSGPDRDGPHGLLPPLQRETLAFERPYEAGLAWTFTGGALRHEFWLDWQRLNTPDHRERFDGGVNTSLRVTRRSGYYHCRRTSFMRAVSFMPRDRSPTVQPLQAA